MAIYRHVPDKDELLVLLLDRLAAELPHPRAVWQFTVGELGNCSGSTPSSTPGARVVREYWAPARDRDAYDIGLSALLDGLLRDPA